MKPYLAYFLGLLLLSGCTNTRSDNLPRSYNADAFPGFVFSDTSKYDAVKLTNYTFQLTDGTSAAFTSCHQVDKADSANIIERDYFRFQLLLTTCQAVKRYLASSPAQKSYFPQQLTKQLISDFPATAVPLINQTDEMQRANKTWAEYDAESQITLTNAASATVVTQTEDIYYYLMGRADFNQDGTEDLLIRSEMYIRDAFGKYVDLLVLSKDSENARITLDWRLVR